jgi:hypothetical protein
LTFISKINLGWINVTEDVAIHEPHISILEESMKKAILPGLEALNGLQMVDVRVQMNSNFITKNGLEEELFNFRSRVEDIVKSICVSFYALVQCLQNFDYYFLQENTFTKDIMDIYKNSKNKADRLKIITEEVKFLQYELERLNTTIPRIFDLGMLTVDISDYLNELKKKVRLYINQLGSRKFVSSLY